MLDSHEFTWMLANLTDSSGAASILSKRFNRTSDKPYTVEAVRKLVEKGQLRALYFEEGSLKIREGKREGESITRGKNWFFLKSDLENLEEPRRGRRW